ncbi:unnamed protein product [Prorocentrum cordatum]|uniref:Subtilisin n=1 Tax=Prorocentrum cordatum TaxID=2364126 RepID=A0ABN9WI45_9DINO|nr:unnamed protein product [Polarella glacialis]
MGYHTGNRTKVVPNLLCVQFAPALGSLLPPPTVRVRQVTTFRRRAVPNAMDSHAVSLRRASKCVDCLGAATPLKFPSYSGAFNITGILTVSGDGDGADARQVLGYFFEGADPLCDVKHGDVGAAA